MGAAPLGLGVLFSLLAALPTPATAQCAPEGDVEFVCGVPGPEDLHAVEGTPWVLASSRISEDDGHIYAVDTGDHSTHVLFPAPTSSVEPDTETYESCPGPPTATFQPHGIALRTGTVLGSSRVHTFYVVGHGPRESVEVFSLELSLDAPESPPTLTWIGCVVAPEGVSLNSVTPLPGEAIAVTNFDVAGGEVWEWRPSGEPSGAPDTSGTPSRAPDTPSDEWTEVPGSEMSGPNGITASGGGGWLYVGGWGEEALVRVSRGRQPIARGSVDVGFHVDNVRWAPGGTLLVAGQDGPSPAAVGGCLDGGSCENVSTRVARIDLSVRTADPVQQLVDYPSNELLPFGTVAIQVGDEIWVGGIAGGDRIARFPLE
ncbi:MAG: hypothetical protein ACLFWG_03680 [Longimicrobiales bacterium]